MTQDLASVKYIENILTGEMRTRSLVIAHQLGIFSCLAEREKTVTEIAQDLELKNISGLTKLMQTLDAINLVNFKSGKYFNSSIAMATLLTDSPSYYGDFINFFADQYSIKNSTKIANNIKQNNLLRPQPTARQWATYMGAMECMANLSAIPIAQAVDLSKAKNLLDLGGGTGQYTIAFCQEYPQLKATIYDLEDSLVHARKNVTASNLQERIDFVTGSATDNDFGGEYDAIFISHTIHLFSPEAVKQMFKTAMNSLTPGGKLIVRDTIMNSTKTTPLTGSLIALNMWVEGETYAFDEVKSLMSAVGYSNIEWIDFCQTEAPEVLGSLVVGQK